MMSFNEQTNKKIQQALINKGVEKPCPSCGNNGFMILGGYFRKDLQQSLTSIQMGGENVPTIATGCVNCGHISEYAARIILPEEF